MDAKEGDAAQAERRSGATSAWGLLIVTLVVAAALGLALALELDLDAAQALLERHREWAALLVVLLMVAHSAAPFPAEILALAAGAVFGVALGAALIWAGAMIGAALTFWICRRLGRPVVRAHLPRKALDRIDGVTGRNLILALTLARLTPVIAFNLVNMVAAITSASWTAFLVTTAFGILPMTVAMVWAGAGMAQLPFAEATVALAALIALLLIAAAVKAYRKRAVTDGRR